MRNRVALGLVAICVLLTLCVVSARGANDPELDFTKGQSAFQQGDYHKALRFFRTARKADPEEPEYAHWEGATLLRLQRFDDAEEALEEAERLAGGGGLPGISYDLGVAYYHTERYEEAEARLNKALREDPGNARARFFYALTMHETGRSEQAVRQLEAVRAQDPGMAKEVSLVLGRIYAETGQNEAAARELRAAAQSGDEQVAQVSRDYLRRIEVRISGKPKRWDFSGYGAVEYDTNVVLNPEDPGVDFPVSNTEDFRTEWYGAFRYHPVATANTTFGFTYGFYQTLHESLTEFDFQGHLPDIHLWWSNGRHAYDGTAGLEYYFLDSDDYLRRWQITNGYSLLEGRSGRTRLFHRYRDDEFFEVPERDGKEHYFGLSQSFFPWQNKRRFVQAGLGYGDRDAGDDYTYTTRALDASFFTPVGEVWYLFAALLYTNYDYEFPDSYFDTVRNDDDWEVACRATYELAEHWNLIAEYRYTEHRSNIEFYDYHRHIMALGVTAYY